MQHDKNTVAAIRAAFADIFRSLPSEQQAARDYVASRILKSASEGELSIEALKQAGSIAVLELYAGVARIEPCRSADEGRGSAERSARRYITTP